MSFADRIAALPRDIEELSIFRGRSSTDFSIDRVRDETLDWSALDRFPKLAHLSYEGTDRSLIEYLATRRITTLLWEADGLAGEFNFCSTHLVELAIQPTKKLTVRLPRSTKVLRYLQVAGTERLRVSAPMDVGIEIQMASRHPPRMPSGASVAKRLSIAFAKRVVIKQLVPPHNCLEELDLHGSFVLVDPENIRKFRELRTLRLDGARLDAERFPANMPALKYVWARGISKRTAEILRDRLRGVDLDIRAARSA